MMKKRVLAFIILGVVAVSLPAACGAGEIHWLYSYDAAAAEAKARNAPIMADFSTSWCGWCVKLDKETFSDPRVIELAGSFVCLKIDADKNAALAAKYRISGYPTVLFLNPQGNKIAGGPGFRDADTMLGEMRSVLNY